MRDENTTDTATTRAVAYMRVSEHAVRDAEAVARRIERQRVRCETIADEHGLTIVHEYVDRTGGLPIHQRPELQRLLSELPTIRARYVVTGDLERVSRSARELVAVEQQLIEVGAELLVWGENEIHAHLRRRMAVLLADYERGQGAKLRRGRGWV
jgi:DNA invertase Pin-like site-specific DNA recombinase